MQSAEKQGTEVKLVLTPLSDEERAVNMEVIKRHWGRDVQRKKTRALIDVALKVNG